MNSLYLASYKYHQSGCGLGSRARELLVSRFVPVPSVNNALRLDMFFPITGTSTAVICCPSFPGKAGCCLERRKARRSMRVWSSHILPTAVSATGIHS